MPPPPPSVPPPQVSAKSQRYDDVNNGKMNWIEAQRAQALLEETLDRLEVLSVLVPDVMENRDGISKMVTTEVTKIIERQQELEMQYAELINRRNALKGLQNKTEYKENQKEIEYVAEQLRQSTKMLCKALKESPKVAENLSKIQAERRSLQAVLTKTYRELQGPGTFTCLKTLLDEQQRHHVNLSQLIKQERESAIVLKKLEKELVEEKEKRDSEMWGFDEAISRLKEELAATKARTTLDSVYGRKTAEAKTNAAQRNRDRVEEGLQHEIDEQIKNMQLEETSGAEMQAYLDKVLTRLKQQKDDWLSKYEKDIENMDTEITNLRSQRAQTLTTLNSIITSAAQCDEFLEAEERYRRESEQAEMLSTRQSNAALRIQAVWRGHQLRKKLAAKKKKKSGKKKGGSPKKR